MQQDPIKTVFDSFDQDKDGFIVKQELHTISKELGHELSQAKIDKIFAKMDINKDGRLSYSEFKEWWIHGKQNSALETLIFQKFKNTKVLNDLEKKKESLGLDLSQKFDQTVSSHKLHIQVGDDFSNPSEETGFLFEMISGQQLEELKQEYKNEFNLDTSYSILLKFKNSQPELLKEQVSTALTEATGMAKEFLPDEQMGLQVEQVSNMISFEYYTSLNALVVKATPKDDVVQQYIASFEGIADSFHQGRKFGLKFEVRSKGDFESAFQENSLPIAHELLKNFSLDFQVESDMQIVELLRSLYFQQVKEQLEINKVNKDLLSVLPLVLLNNSKISLKYKSIDEVCQYIPPIFAGKDLVNQAKGFSLNELISQVPFVESLTKVFAENGQSQFEILAVTEKFAIRFALNLKNLGKLWDQIIN